MRILDTLIQRLPKIFPARDTETLQKSQALLIIILIHVLLLQPFLILHIMLFGLCKFLLFPFVMTLLFLASIYMLKKGYYEISAHGIIISFMAVVWISCLYNIMLGESIWIIMTHFMYILTSFGLFALHLFKRKYTISLYVVVNLLILLITLSLMDSRYSLAKNERFALFVYPVVCFLYAGVIAHLNFRAGRHMLEKYESALDQVRISEGRYHNLYNNTLTGMICVETPTGRITSANETAVLLLGYTTEDEIQNEILFQSLLVDQNAFPKILASLRDNNSYYVMETNLRKKDNGIFWAELALKYCSQSRRIDICFVDITERKNAEQNLHHLKYFDQLTSLPNRLSFLQRVDSEIEKAGRKNRSYISAVLCVGIDNFRKINDVYGAVAGDAVLGEMAFRLMQLIRDDDIASRLRGDMFLVFLNELGGHDEINHVMEKITKTAGTPFSVESNIIDVTVSMGLCFFPDDGRTAMELVEKSESALYIAKSRGRNTCHVHDSRLNTLMINNFKLEKDLTKAIREEEFVSFYQAKLDRQGFVSGIEVLIRWNSPERGLVPPGAFIPLAEKNGMIRDIGRIVLRQACVQMKDWVDRDIFTGSISVNVSPLEFHDPALMDSIETILNATGLNPRFLELEITESSLVIDEKECIDKLTRLHDMGIAIAIDDFGTGYSSLNKLRDLPIDTLKIDRSFVEKLPDDIRSCTITRAIVDLAHNLGFAIVAEGVETKDQFQYLKNLECDSFQGYYFSKPVPAKECEKILAEHKGSLKN
ncbi:MAG: hypothetical protein CVV44_10365 [Spirochaetae bacterium HGW-Spirochaetae-1]|jgi:diguanylate cyclase (GGDEF)-like protein/PAS domain S-box-containing protein|nr:MAG: hypothetical protein CVV44_10365 [Spirochaetae bacterium HGW-Spirochaetae-1]